MTSSTIAEPHSAGTTSAPRGFLAALFAGAVVLLLGTDDGVVLCPYRRCTGGDCPLCGVTRASAQLARGDLVGSIQLHPMVVVWALQILLWTAVARRANRTAPRQQSWWRQHGSTVLLANVSMATVVWLVRLFSGGVAPPTGLTLPW